MPGVWAFGVVGSGAQGLGKWGLGLGFSASHEPRSVLQV